jgi:hypothetical protein
MRLTAQLLCIHFRIMGRHSGVQKRTKRWNQKRRKRIAQVRSSGDEQSEGSTSSGTSDQFIPEVEFHQPAKATDGLFEALDRVSEDSDDYWEQMSEEKRI